MHVLLAGARVFTASGAGLAFINQEHFHLGCASVCGRFKPGSTVKNLVR